MSLRGCRMRLRSRCGILLQMEFWGWMDGICWSLGRDIYLSGFSADFHISARLGKSSLGSGWIEY
jgi:hypothetical protein